VSEEQNVSLIASALTAPQRYAFERSFPDRIQGSTTPACRCALQRKGLVVNRMYAEDFTPLGREVRAHIFAWKGPAK